jgi:hypothetical protein
MTDSEKENTRWGYGCFCLLGLVLGVIGTLVLATYLGNNYPRQEEFDHYNCQYDLHHGNRMDYPCWEWQVYRHAGVDWDQEEGYYGPPKKQ